MSTPSESSSKKPRKNIIPPSFTQNTIPPITAPPYQQRHPPQNPPPAPFQFPDPFQYQPLPREPLSPVGGIPSLQHRHDDPASDIWRPQSYANTGRRKTSRRTTPSLYSSTSRMPLVNSVQRLSVLAAASPTAPAAPSANVNSLPRQSVVPAAVPLAHVTSLEVEELRDRLFKLTSDYQRLYGVFMPMGASSWNAERWNTVDIDLPFLSSIRQHIVDLLTATRRFENGEKVNNDQAFFASQHTFFNSLVAVVGSAIEKLTALRRALEGPDGYPYQYRSWYYQVIGNNPRSTDTSSAPADEENKERDAWGMIIEAGKSGDGDGGLESPSLDPEDETEARSEKRTRM
ncbi:hypothetical protein OCU04_006616 [Sclerotinia nivalis]|uniref:Uncharacterized protein n=1 Tax=Sclerotinia nivalis TaxID=352851 RepID=A0A9X0AKA3_9HELO|nr:hypothetical protein OCU04_006616 [Sclerotinia nivalis]